MMINANKIEDCVRLAMELQGKSINQGKNLIKEYAGYSVGCKMKIPSIEEINNKDGFTIYITFTLVDERNDSIVECIGVREFGAVTNVYPTVEEMCKVIDKLGMDIDKGQHLESICEDFVDAIGYCRITDLDDFYGNFARVEYQWEVFPTEGLMIGWEDIELMRYNDICIRMEDNEKLDWTQSGRCMDDTEVGSHLYNTFKVNRMSQDEFEKFVEQLLLETEQVLGKCNKQCITNDSCYLNMYDYYFENNAYRLRCTYIVDEEDVDEVEYDKVEFATWK